MIHDSLEKFKALLDDALPKLNAISNEEWCDKPFTGKWSKKEILGHLIDSAANNHHRFIRAQYHHSPSIVYDQDAWINLHNYQGYDAKLLISFWLLYNQHLIHIIKNIPENNLDKTCHNGIDSTVTLSGLTEDYIAHLQHHLKQIIDLQKWPSRP